MNLVEKVKLNPKWHYAFSICATWAGAGSLIVGINFVKQYGVVPFILWALGNTLCCVVFGLLAGKLPTLRAIFTSKVMKIVVGLMCIFQLWVNMSGINDSLKIISPAFAVATTYILSITFLLLYLKYAMLKNIITDDIGWKVVYGMIFGILLIALCKNGFAIPSAGMVPAHIKLGVQRFFTLMVGPFFYPYFWELFNYNGNGDCKPTDMSKAFALGGMLFGIYLCFVFVLGCTTFTPQLEVAKGILLSLIALSSLTSFIYSIYISFGLKIGFVVNTFGMVAWSLLVPLGVMKIWSAMQDIRFVMVVAVCLYAGIKTIYDKHKSKN